MLLTFSLHLGIEEIEAGAFISLITLRTLYLDGNTGLQLRGGMWEGIDTLHVLSLEDCGLTEIDGSVWQGLDELRILDLDKNHISRSVFI